MRESVYPFVQSGIADRVLSKLKTSYGMKPDLEDCFFSVKEAEDIYTKKKVPQVVVEFKNPFFSGMKNQKERLIKAFALGPTALSEGKSIFTQEQQQFATILLNQQKEYSRKRNKA
jgi:hypothetical protein